MERNIIEKNYVGKVEKAGVFAFRQDFINFDIAGFDVVDAARFMPPGTWNLISSPDDIRLYRTQGDEETVRQAFIASGRKVRRIYQVVDGKPDFYFLNHERETCPLCGGQKNVGMECDCTFWGRKTAEK